MGRGVSFLLIKLLIIFLIVLFFSCSGDLLDAVKEKIELDRNGPPVFTWAKSYGGAGIGFENCYEVNQTADGGYIAAGYSQSFGAGDFDIWILKLSAKGSIIWEKSYGGASSDSADVVKQTTDGGYIVAGSTNSYGQGASDLWLLKLNSKGGVVWQKTYGEASGEYIHSMMQSSDGGFIIAGETFSFGSGGEDAWIIHTLSEGSIDWQQTFGGTGDETITNIQQTSDRGYIAAGETDSFGAGGSDIWVLKLDSQGNLLWQKTYGGSGDDDASSVIQTSDGGYMVAGHLNGAPYDCALLLKLKSNGDIEWQQKYDDTGFNSFTNVKEFSDGGYICTGFTDTMSAGSSDFWLVKLGSNGTVLWQKIYGGSGDDAAFSIGLTLYGGYILGGTTASYGAGGADFWLVKTSGEGDPVFTDPANDVYLGQETTITVSETSIVPVDTSVIGVDTNAVVHDTSVTGADTNATVKTQYESW